MIELGFYKRMNVSKYLSTFIYLLFNRYSQTPLLKAFFRDFSTFYILVVQSAELAFALKINPKNGYFLTYIFKGSKGR